MLLAIIAVLLTGAVALPATEVFSALFGRGEVPSFVDTIVWETRIPMAIAAICCGAMLSAAGLMMQTYFHNPLAGPSVMGISSGASFGVAILMLSSFGLGSTLPAGWQPFVNVLAAMAGGMATVAVLYVFSAAVRSGVTLLIVGIMISYLCTSGISLLNYFSPAEGIRNYLVWGLGSYTSLRFSTSMWLAVFTLLALLPTIFFAKPLNAMLMGEIYLESVGYSARRLRGGMLIATGLLVAVPTAFCGPIGFIGLIVPHLCRLLFQTSNHFLLLPACIMYGALISLLCALLGVVPASAFGVLPINVITPIIGVPVILYLLVNRNRIPYFS